MRAGILNRLRGGPWGLLPVILGAILMVAGGLWGTWVCIAQPLRDAWQTRDWVATPAVLDEVWIQGSGGFWRPPEREGKIDREARMASMPYGQLSLHVRYHYTVGDQVYESTGYGLHRYLSDGDHVRQAAAEMYRRQDVVAFVNPQQPSQAVLNRQLYWVVFLFGLPAIGMGLIGGMMVWSSVLTLLQVYWPSAYLKIKPYRRSVRN